MCSEALSTLKFCLRWSLYVLFFVYVFIGQSSLQRSTVARQSRIQSLLEAHHVMQS